MASSSNVIIAMLVCLCSCAGSTTVTNSTIPGDINIGVSKARVLSLLGYGESALDTIRSPGMLGGIPGVWDVCFSQEERVQWALFSADYRYSDSLETMLVRVYGDDPSHYRTPSWSYFGSTRVWLTESYIITFQGTKYPEDPTEYLKNTVPENFKW